MYVSVLCWQLNPRSILVYLSGISQCLEPSYPSINLITNSPAVRCVPKSCVKSFSPPVKHSQPFLLGDFDTAVAASSSSYDDILFLTLLSFGFTGLHQLGEITSPDSSCLWNPRAIMQRSSLLVSNPPTHFKYSLLYSKVDQNFLGQTIVTYLNPHPQACAVSHLFKYLSVWDPSSLAHSALFITSSGLVPTQSWFLRCFWPIFLFQKTGHSLWSGGATYLANRGVSMSLIKEVGCWSSNTFELYIHLNPILWLPADLASASSAPVLPRTQLSFHPLPYVLIHIVHKQRDPNFSFIIHSLYRSPPDPTNQVQTVHLHPSTTSPSPSFNPTFFLPNSSQFEEKNHKLLQISENSYSSYFLYFL